MPILDINLNGDGAWPELRDCAPDKIFRTDHAKMVALEGGMQSGRPSVAIRIDLPDGQVVIWETSVGQFQQAAAALRGRFGDQT